MSRGLLLLLALASLRAQAQAEHSHVHSPETQDSGQAIAEPDEGAAMSGPLGISLNRTGSGTAWQPDNTPMAGMMFQPGAGWDLMLHWNLLAGFDAQTTPRGGHQWTSMNWVMAMAQHAMVGGQFTGRLMLSAEPFSTGGKRGYPLLLQTGEEVDGQILHDRQHPHDLFMEVAVDYARPLTPWLAFQVYAALSGEPALGPVAFPHRESAMPNPFAALGHHWQDSTHISFGVLTAGFYTRQWKLEGSWFNGREPDENRYGFDFGSFDSWSARLSYNPSDDWSLQISYGYLPSPEEHDPGVGVDRVTASALHDRRLGDDANWATAVVFGKNWYSGHPSTLSALVESSLQLGANNFFGRVEFFQRTGDDLALEEEPGAAGGIGRQVFNSGVLELGYIRRVATLGPLNVGLGAVGSIYALDAGLQPFYGNQQFPVAGMLFLRLWPTPMEHGHMGHGAMHGGAEHQNL